MRTAEQQGLLGTAAAPPPLAASAALFKKYRWTPLELRSTEQPSVPAPTSCSEEGALAATAAVLGLSLLSVSKAVFQTRNYRQALVALLETVFN